MGKALQGNLFSLLSAYICAITHPGGHWVKPYKPVCFLCSLRASASLPTKVSIGPCPAVLPDFIALCAQLRHYTPRWALGKALQSNLFSLLSAYICAITHPGGHWLKPCKAICFLCSLPMNLRHYPPRWALGKALQASLLLSALCARLRHYPLRCVSGSALQSCLIFLLSARVCAITHPGGHWVKPCKAIRISLLSAYICAITHPGGHWVKPCKATCFLCSLRKSAPLLTPGGHWAKPCKAICFLCSLRASVPLPTQVGGE